MPMDYEVAEQKALLDRIAFLEARHSELQAKNVELEARARKAETVSLDAKLKTAALNLYRLDWVWAHKTDAEPSAIGAKFWVELREALGLPPNHRFNKWTISQQRAAVEVVESMHPVHHELVKVGP